MKERIQSFELKGTAGQLEALLHTDESREPTSLAVVCHPHPLYGGTMHNKVVHRIDRALFESGCTVLRFNYRGVGASHGRWDEGYGETEDTRAAVDALLEAYPGRPLLLAGFSFGAARALEVGWRDPRISRLIGVGTPDYAVRELSGPAPKPLLLIHGTDDEAVPIGPAKSWAETLAGDVTFVEIRDSDHFFVQHLDALESTVRDWASK